MKAIVNYVMDRFRPNRTGIWVAAFVDGAMIHTGRFQDFFLSFKKVQIFENI